MPNRVICPGCGRPTSIHAPVDVLTAARALEFYDLEPEAVVRLRQVRVFRLHRTGTGGICPFGRRVVEGSEESA